AFVRAGLARPRRASRGRGGIQGGLRPPEPGKPGPYESTPARTRLSSMRGRAPTNAARAALRPRQPDAREVLKEVVARRHGPAADLRLAHHDAVPPHDRHDVALLDRATLELADDRGAIGLAGRALLALEQRVELAVDRMAG